MARPDLEKKIKEAKEKYGDKKPESFDEQISRVKAKYTKLLAGAQRKLKKNAQMGYPADPAGALVGNPGDPLQKGDVIDIKRRDDHCPECKSDNIANEDDGPEVTCHDCSHQWDESDPPKPKKKTVKKLNKLSKADDGGKPRPKSLRDLSMTERLGQPSPSLQKDDDDSEGVKALRARMKQPSRLRPGSSDEKIKAALQGQAGTNPYASAGPGGGRGGVDYSSPSKPEPKAKPVSALERMRQRVAANKGSQDRNDAASGKGTASEQQQAHDDRTARIRGSLSKINSLMQKLKENRPNGPEEEPRTQLEILQNKPADLSGRDEPAPKAAPQAKPKRDEPHPKRYEEGRSASERMLTRTREAVKKDQANMQGRQDDVYKAVHGDKAFELRQAHDKMGPAIHTERAPGSDADVKYHGEDDKGRHHFSVGGRRSQRHSFVMTKNAKGKADVEHIPQEVSEYKVKSERGTWKPLDIKLAAKDHKHSHENWGMKGMKSAATRVKQSGKFAELIGKQKQATPFNHKDFEAIRTSNRGYEGEGHSFSTRQKHGGKGYFNYQYHPKENAYTYHDYSKNESSPRADKDVFEHIIKQSSQFKAKHKDGEEPKLISHQDFQKQASPLKVVKSAKMEKSMQVNPKLVSQEATHTLHGVKVKHLKDYGNGTHAVEIMEGEHKGKWTQGHEKDLKPSELQKNDPGGMKAAFGTPPPAPPPSPTSDTGGGSLASNITASLGRAFGKSDEEPDQFAPPANLQPSEAQQWHMRQAEYHKKQAMHHEMNASKHDDPRYSTNMAGHHEDDARQHTILANKLSKMKQKLSNV